MKFYKLDFTYSVVITRKFSFCLARATVAQWLLTQTNAHSSASFKGVPCICGPVEKYSNAFCWETMHQKATQEEEKKSGKMHLFFLTQRLFSKEKNEEIMTFFPLRGIPCHRKYWRGMAAVSRCEEGLL